MSSSKHLRRRSVPDGAGMGSIGGEASNLLLTLRGASKLSSNREEALKPLLIRTKDSVHSPL